MSTHGPHAFLMRRHIPHHEIGVIRACHAYVAIVRKSHGVNTAKVPPKAAIEPEPLEGARSRADPPAHRLVRDARTLLPPEEQVKSQGILMVVMGRRRRRRGTDGGRSCFLHGLESGVWSGVGAVVLVHSCLHACAPRGRAGFTLCCCFSRRRCP